MGSIDSEYFSLSNFQIDMTDCIDEEPNIQPKSIATRTITDSGKL